MEGFAIENVFFRALVNLSYGTGKQNNYLGIGINNGYVYATNGVSAIYKEIEWLDKNMSGVYNVESVKVTRKTRAVLFLDHLVIDSIRIELNEGARSLPVKDCIEGYGKSEIPGVFRFGTGDLAFNFLKSVRMVDGILSIVPSVSGDIAKAEYDGWVFALLGCSK